MPRRLALLLLPLFSCGIYRAITGEESSDVTEIRRVARKGGPYATCPAMVVEERDWSHEMQYLVTGCSHDLACQEIGGQMRCFDSPPRISDFGEARLPEGFLFASKGVALATGCPSTDAKITTLETPSRGGRGLYRAVVCGREFNCAVGMSRRGDLDPDEVRCDETEASAAATTEAVLVDRLALETGCPAENIHSSSKAAWVRGTERASRLTACGKAYVCTTAAGRTDCKVALDAVEPPPPQPAPAEEQPKVEEPQIRPPDPPIPAKKPLKAAP